MKLFNFLIACVALSNIILAQISDEVIQYRNDEYGDRTARKESVLDGNNIRTLFYNNGEIAQWPFSPSAEWPKGTGQGYLDGFALLISAEKKIDNIGTADPNDSLVFHSLITSYREWMDQDPVTGEIWGMEPLPGYSNQNSDKIAMTTDYQSWPIKWPQALGLDESWDGSWYGYFGKDKMNANQETFFVMDDSKDAEFARPPWNYFPIASDSNRKGLGLRIEVRNFAWEHEDVADIIFTHYSIMNISDHDYIKAYTGFYIDAGIGGTGDSGDDYAKANLLHNTVYMFDNDGFGSPGRFKTGYLGIGFLESPSNPFNGIDDDDDGLIDERRDDGIDNDNDWVSYSDLNGNFQWDENEPLNSDLGADGLGPNDMFYTGPDLGEGDGIPTDGEPNYDRTDLDESDMVGLTSLSVYRLGDGGTGGGWPKGDEAMWRRLQYINFDTSLSNANISLTMGTGPFKFDQARKQRVSTALIFAENYN